MEPNKSQFGKVISMADYKANKEEQTQPGERKWGPQHAGVVKDYEKKD
jgi:hypothetical protein